MLCLSFWTRLMPISMTIALLGAGLLQDSSFAQGSPTPGNRTYLIDTKTPETVTQLLQRQEKTHQDKIHKTANLAKAKKQALLDKKNRGKLAQKPKPQTKLAKYPAKNLGEAVGVNHPIAIPNRIEPDGDAVSLRLDTAPFKQSAQDFAVQTTSLSSSRSGMKPVSQTQTMESVSLPQLESKGFVPTAYAGGAALPKTTPINTLPDVLPLKAPSATLDTAPSVETPSTALPNLNTGASAELQAKTKISARLRRNTAAMKVRVKDWIDTPRQPLPDRMRDVVDSMVNTSHEPKKNGRPIGYEPLSGIAVFPVIRHKDDKAFGDIPLMFAREYAAKMASKTGEQTKIYNPTYTMDTIRQRGLGPVYDKIMAYYIRAGRPEPNATEYLLKQIAEDGKPITRIMFVESDVDMNAPDAATGFLDRISGVLTDSTPKNMKMMVRNRVQIFNTENPDLPRLWGGSWQRSVTVSHVRNMTKSVYDDTDSEQAFGSVSRRISQELLYIMPREAYMVPVYDSTVHAKILKSPATDEPAAAAEEPLSNEDKQELHRILER
jgi:hypothetical protein